MKRVRILAILLAIAMCVGLFPTVSFAQEELSTTSAPENYTAENTYLDNNDDMSLFSDDKKVLLVEDVNPWNSTANQEVLSGLTQYKKVTTAEFLKVDLSEYGVIVFANDQPFNSYENYKEFKEYMEKFASIGGVIVFGACDSGWSGGELTEALPGDVKKNENFSEYNYISDFTHPIVTTALTENVPLVNADLQSKYCSHISFDEDTLPPGSKIILRAKNNDQPTLVEYPLGKGRVIASGLTWEHNYVYGGEVISNINVGYFAAKALDDMYKYAIRVSSIDVDDVHVIKEYYILNNRHYIIVSDSSFNAIEGANIEINNQTITTNSDGVAVYIGPFGKYEVKVSADGYKDCVQYYNIQPKALKNIVLEKDENADTKPYITSAYDEDTGRDLRYQAKKFKENSPEMIDITISANWGSYNADEYLIYQEGDVNGDAGSVIKTTDGKFSFAPGQILKCDRQVKAKLIADDGTESEPVDLNLLVYTEEKYINDNNNNVDNDDNKNNNNNKNDNNNDNNDNKNDNNNDNNNDNKNDNNNDNNNDNKNDNNNDNNNNNNNNNNDGVDVSLSVSQYMVDNYVLLSATVSNNSSTPANTAISITEDTEYGIVLDMKNIGVLTNESDYVYVYLIDKNSINFAGQDYKNYHITVDTIETDINPSNNKATIAIYPNDEIITDPDNIIVVDIVPVTGITTPDEVVLKIGDEGVVTYQLEAEITPENASNKSVKWYSDNNAVSVDENGLISAYTTGSAKITAVTYDGNFSSVTNVTVISDKDTAYVVPDGTTDISEGDLDDYINITVIYIPKSVTVIDEGTFEKFKRLKDVYYGGMEEDWKIIQIGDRNDPLFNATIHYTLPEPVIETEDIPSGKRVSISTVKNADIYYTTDGSVPNTESTKYTTPFDITEECSVTVKAIAVKADYTDSDAAEKTVTLEKAPMPTASLESGEVKSRSNVSLSSDGTIYFTVNDSEEGIYTEPLTIDTDMTIKAYAVKSGYAKSDTAEFVYTIQQIPELNDGDGGTSGTCSWRFNGDTLYIYGSGTMASYADGETPWYGGKYQIKHIIIDEGIQNIGSFAFSGLEAAEDIKIPSTVNTVGNYAMNDCHSLKSVELSPEMKSGIGVNAFRNCTSLTNVGLPDGVTQISNGAFDGCSSLTDITLPFIGSAVGRENNKNTFSYIFGENVPESLKNVTITHETNVPEKAFENCANIETITINDGIETIGASAFDGCASLTGFTVADGITDIADYTFRGCKSAENITVPNSVASIGVSAFEDCAALKEINIPDGVGEIKDNTFKNCASLTKIEIPDSVQVIGTDTLAGCNSLLTLKIPFVGANSDPGVTEITNEGVLGYLFGEGNWVTQGDKSYAIPASLTKVEVTNPDKNNYIPMGAFANCANLKDIVVDGGNKVLDNAFSNCRNLRTLYLPKSLATIGEAILENCTSLETLTVPFIGTGRQDKNAETSVLGAFFGKGTTSVQQGDVEQEYGNNKSDNFNIPKSLKNVTVLNQTDIPYGAFMNCANVEYVSIIRGAVIYDKAFYNCASLKQVSLPSDMREIGYEAFANCESLEKVNIPANASKIGNYAFYGDDNLQEITIPKSVTAIADDVFAGTPFVLNSMDLMDVSENETGAAIVCSEGSYAQQYAEENGIRYRLTDENRLNVKNTSTVITKHSDGLYYFDITDTNKLKGNLYIAFYDEDGVMVNVKKLDAGSVEYHVSFTEEYMEKAATAKIFVWESDTTIKPQTSDCEKKNF